MPRLEYQGEAGLVSDPLRPGQILDGRYRIDAPLGTGGMAFVYRATHVRLGTPVAIKVVTPRLGAVPEATERFEREAKAVIQLRGENVVRVLDVGTTPGQLPYMAMEFLPGQDLDEVLSTRRVLAVDEAVDYVLQACKALAEAHRVGIVHRDLKPSNLFLTVGADNLPCIKLIDFGISRIDAWWDNEPTARLTNPGGILGSPGYMAPEQMESPMKAGACSDIWGVGAVLYELLTGEQPYGGDSYWNIFAAATLSEPRRPSEIRPDVPKALDAVVLRCLRADPTKRYGSVAELAAALVPFGRHRAREHAEAVARLLNEPLPQAESAFDSLPVENPAFDVPAVPSSWEAFDDTVAVSEEDLEPVPEEVRPPSRAAEPTPRRRGDSSSKGTILAIYLTLTTLLLAGTIRALAIRGAGAAQAAPTSPSTPATTAASSVTAAAPSATAASSVAAAASSAARVVDVADAGSTPLSVPKEPSAPVASTTAAPSATQPPRVPEKRQAPPSAPAANTQDEAPTSSDERSDVGHDTR